MAAPAEVGPALPTLAEIRAAAARIAGIARRTPLERCGWLSERAGADVFLKLECWQPTRSFKVRGAANAILGLGPASASRGVVTASAGNHGQAVALVAARAGIPAVVHVPATAPAVKKQRIRALGALLEDSAPDYDAAEALAARHAEHTGATLVHAFSDPAVVCGQATVGLEILAELPDCGSVVVPVGGGGLIAGIGAVLRAAGSTARLIGAQSERTRNMYEAFAAGTVVDCAIEPTLADGLAGCTDQPAYLRARAVTDALHLVSEAAIGAALRAHLARDGLLLEGSGAVATAALLERIEAPGPTVLVLTGGNIDPATLATVLRTE
ncbi:MAG TPA: pyridoxal-phosphate dependent enzyme [Longimicrobiales bacterium]|nr:pyridoxal-phosphate dependent enzyme [Longimicrobiales bacterium]